MRKLTNGQLVRLREANRIRTQRQEAEESEVEEMASRNSKGQFAKGSSGNPSGRPKRTEKEAEILMGIYSLSEIAVETVKEIMQDKENSASVRLRASEIVIERICGKPMDGNQIDKYEDNQKINSLFDF